MPPEEEEEFVTDLAMKANGLHELFMAYVQAGFTREEAMQIILTVLQMGMVFQHRPE